MNHVQHYLLLPNSVLSTWATPCVIQEPSTELYWLNIISVTTTALEALFPFDSRHWCPSPTPSNAHPVFRIPLVVLEPPGLPGLKFSSNTQVKWGGHRMLPGPVAATYTPPFYTNLLDSPFRKDSHLHSNSPAQPLLGLPYLTLFVPHDWLFPQGWLLLSPAPSPCISWL